MLLLLLLLLSFGYRGTHIGVLLLCARMTAWVRLCHKGLQTENATGICDAPRLTHSFVE